MISALLCLLSLIPQATIRAGNVQRATLPAQNVLVIIADDIGWTERAYFPASLDSLAAQGTTFTRAYSWPTCSPTRLAALFGHYPRRDGIGDLSLNAHLETDDRLPLSLVSVAEVFAPTYQTALFGKWHLGRAPLDNGSDLALPAASMARVQGPLGPYCQGFELWRAGSPTVVAAGSGAPNGYYDWWRVDDGLMQTETLYATAAQRDEFLAWWTGTSGPKFGVLSWSAAHTPYDTPPGYTPHPTTRGKFLQVADYLDQAMADVLAAVSLTDTIVVFISDNGTPDDARDATTPSGYWKGSTFEGGVRVPLIVAGPGIAQGTSSRLVSIVDIPATLCELANLPNPGLDSQSFADALGSWTGSAARSFVFAERYETRQPGPTAPQPEGYDDSAIIEASWKMRVVDADGIGAGGKAELVYYLPTDPYELAPSPGWTTSDGTSPPQGLTTAQQNALSVATTRLRAELASMPARKP